MCICYIMLQGTLWFRTYNFLFLILFRTEMGRRGGSFFSWYDNLKTRLSSWHERNTVRMRNVTYSCAKKGNTLRCRHILNTDSKSVNVGQGRVYCVSPHERDANAIDANLTHKYAYQLNIRSKRVLVRTSQIVAVSCNAHCSVRVLLVV